MFDIYCIGEMLIDFIPGSEEGSYIRNAGGAPANVAIAAARNSLKSAMCCKVGDDDFGKFLTETLKRNNVVPICEKPCIDAVTTMAFVSLDSNGERSFTFARKPGADMFLSAEAVKSDDIESSVIVHAGSCSLSAGEATKATAKALALGRKLNKLVSFDVNYRDNMWDGDLDACTEAVAGILPFVDILKISEEELSMFKDRGGLFDLMRGNNIALIVLTLGADGADAYYNGEIIHTDGIKTEAVDTTGAGDAFWGGFLSSLRIQGVERAEQLNKNIIENAMKYGNISGSLCVAKKGAISSLPTREKIEEIMR